MNNYTSSGIEVLGDISLGTHLCQFYETKDDLLEMLVPYFKTGLENKEFCLWVVSSKGLLTKEEAKKALAEAVPDFDRHLINKDIEILDESEWYLAEGKLKLEWVIRAWLEKHNRALAMGYSGIRVSGDTLWLSEKDWKDFYTYEKKINDFTAGLNMTVLCTYSLEQCGAAEILDVVDAHQFTIARRKGKWEMVETATQMQAQAEIKRLNEAMPHVKEQVHKLKAILSYGVAVLSVIAALIILFLTKIYLPGAAPHASVFFCAVIFSTWFGGVRPGLFSIMLAAVAFDYYFLPPIYSFAIYPTQFPRLLFFIIPSLFIVWLSAAQRMISESLRQARNVLEKTVQKLRQTNITLREEIAERKRAEEELRKSEDRIRLIINTIPTMAWTLLPGGTVDFVNQRWIDYVGHSLDEMENPLGIVHPEDLPRVMEKWRANMAESKFSEDEMRLRRADGEYRWFLVRTAPLHDEQGNPVKWYGVSIDIDDNKQAEEKLKLLNAELHNLSSHLQNIQENERTTIAREIHDELGQLLTGLKMEVGWLTRKLHDDPVLKAKGNEILSIIGETLKTVKKIAVDLRPNILDELGLIAALEWQGQEFEKSRKTEFHFHTDLNDFNPDRNLSTNIFRVHQEALTNIARHAHATRIETTLEKKDNWLRLTIQDDGKGFDLEEEKDKNSFGLVGMKERALMLRGKLIIETEKGKGTVITLKVPLVKMDEKES